VALTESAAVINPVNNEINTIPNNIHIMQNARAYGDLGERSPYLIERNEKVCYTLSFTHVKWLKNQATFFLGGGGDRLSFRVRKLLTALPN